MFSAEQPQPIPFPKFEVGTNFKAWMFSVARFKVMALWRDQKRRKVWSVPEETLHLLIEDAAEVCYEVEDARPEPGILEAAVSPQTRWTVNGVAQEARGGPVDVVEGSTVQVASGTVRLALDSGELLALRGPAEVAFPSLRRPWLKSGWLWLDTGSSDEGFEVEAAGLQIRDVGTRFGVRVPVEGPVEVHLVEGRVEVLDRPGGTRVAGFDQPGTAFVVEGNGKTREIDPAVDPFPDMPTLLSGPADYRAAVMGQAPAGYWTLDDEAADRRLANRVRGSSTGFLAEKVRAGEPGIGPLESFDGFPAANRSLFMEGGSDQSVVAGLDGLHGVKRREGAVSFWIRRNPADTPREEILWLAGAGTGERRVPDEAALHARLTASGRVLFEIENGDDDVSVSSARNIADGSWHHVVASWGPSSVDLYIDGSLNARDAESRSLEDGRFRGRFVRFGKPSRDLYDTFDAYTGWVDEIALWNRPLTGTEVALQFEAAKGVVQGDSTGGWKPR
ncbi:LamG-like jellyroll fold domain-containing protein [Haloferula sp. A504]|uniref:LamG-like jellyroll fold domain-containing protein n=1 Tax=Haloferula sp. A504 TaxID=3373601 RepID=UPI0031CB1212|nr:LamG domain-containing protein [Verrucomicrobiaceae bacterium E54]